MKHLLRLVLLFACASVPGAQPAPELLVGRVHLGMKQTDLRKVLRAPVYEKKVLSWHTWYFVSQDSVARLPLADLWEPVYFIDFNKDGSIQRVLGRVATIRGKVVEFGDTQDKVKLLLGAPDARWNSEDLENYYYDASDRSCHVNIGFAKPGLGVSMIQLFPGAHVSASMPSTGIVHRPTGELASQSAHGKQTGPGISNQQPRVRCALRPTAERGKTTVQLPFARSAD